MLTAESINKMYIGDKEIKKPKLKSKKRAVAQTQESNVESVLEDIKKLKQISRSDFIRQSSLGAFAIDKALKTLVGQGLVKIEVYFKGNLRSNIIYYLGDIK